jgi:hypothetical protein
MQVCSGSGAWIRAETRTRPFEWVVGGGARKPRAKVCVSFLSHLLVLHRRHRTILPLRRSSLGRPLALSSLQHGIDAGLAAYAIGSLVVGVFVFLTPAHQLLLLLAATPPSIFFRSAATDAASFLFFLCCRTRIVYPAFISSPATSSAYADILSDTSPSLPSQANRPARPLDYCPASLLPILLAEKAAADRQRQCDSLAGFCLLPPKTTASRCAGPFVHSLLH